MHTFIEKWRGCHSFHYPMDTDTLFRALRTRGPCAVEHLDHVDGILHVTATSGRVYYIRNPPKEGDAILTAIDLVLQEEHEACIRLYAEVKAGLPAHVTMVDDNYDTFMAFDSTFQIGYSGTITAATSVPVLLYTIDKAMKRPLVIGIHGAIGVGKTTCANFIKQIYGEKATILGFAEPLKEAARILWRFTTDQLYGTQAQKATIDPRWNIAPRTALQKLGTDMIRRSYRDDFFLQHMKLTVGVTKQPVIVIHDVRFINEADFVLKELGGIIFHLHSTRAPETTKHESDIPLPPDLVTYHIDNNGTMEDLMEELMEILAQQDA